MRLGGDGTGRGREGRGGSLGYVFLVGFDGFVADLSPPVSILYFEERVPVADCKVRLVSLPGCSCRSSWICMYV